MADKDLTNPTNDAEVIEKNLRIRDGKRFVVDLLNEFGALTGAPIELINCDDNDLSYTNAITRSIRQPVAVPDSASAANAAPLSAAVSQQILAQDDDEFFDPSLLTRLPRVGSPAVPPTSKK